MIKKFIVFFVMAVALHASGQSLLSGRVTDNQGVPIAFTSIYINGTTTGTTANPGGYYQIKLKRVNTSSIIFLLVLNNKQMRLRLPVIPAITYSLLTKIISQNRLPPK